MKKLLSIIAVAAVAMGALVLPALPVSAAVNCVGVNCLTAVNNIAPSNTNLETGIKNIINGVIYILGFIAVAVVIYGGVQYTLSAGAADKVKNAKNTILYGIIGLIVAVLAFAIVNFVVTALL